MCPDEGVPRDMNAVVYLSYTGNSKKVAAYLSRLLSFPCLDLHILKERSFKHLLFVAPVHAERLPDEAISFLKEAQAEEMILVATYGRMNHGNALLEVQRKFRLPLVGAAYFPTRHSYLANDRYEPPYERLAPLAKAFGSGRYIIVPESQDTFGRGFFPKLRARFAVHISVGEGCTHCHLCEEACPFEAIVDGRLNRRCIRCLACVKACPNEVLSFRLSPPLARYLSKPKSEETLIYIGSEE